MVYVVTNDNGEMYRNLFAKMYLNLSSTNTEKW